MSDASTQKPSAQREKQIENQKLAAIYTAVMYDPNSIRRSAKNSFALQIQSMTRFPLSHQLRFMINYLSSYLTARYVTESQVDDSWKPSTV